MFLFFSFVVFLAFAFLLSCCTNTVCSVSSTGMEKCAQVGWMRALSPKVCDRGKQAAAALIKPHVSGLKRVFSSIICLFSMSLHNFCRSEFCCTGDHLPKVESTFVLSNLAGNFLVRDPQTSHVNLMFIHQLISQCHYFIKCLIFIPELCVAVLEPFNQINTVCK